MISRCRPPSSPTHMGAHSLRCGVVLWCSAVWCSARMFCLFRFTTPGTHLKWVPWLLNERKV